jgi:hypothetical protein
MHLFGAFYLSAIGYALKWLGNRTNIPGQCGLARGIRAARRQPMRRRLRAKAITNSHRREPRFCYLSASCRGRYHTDRQRGAASQYTAMCPAVPPPARSRTAWAGGQSHSTHATMISPGPHSCPFWQRSG